MASGRGYASPCLKLSSFLHGMTHTFQSIDHTTHLPHSLVVSTISLHNIASKALDVRVLQRSSWWPPSCQNCANGFAWLCAGMVWWCSTLWGQQARGMCTCAYSRAGDSATSCMSRARPSPRACPPSQQVRCLCLGSAFAWVSIVEHALVLGAVDPDL